MQEAMRLAVRLALAAALSLGLSGCLPGELTDAELEKIRNDIEQSKGGGEPCDPNKGEICCPGGLPDCANQPAITCRYPRCVAGRCEWDDKPKAPGSPCHFDGCPEDNCMCAGPKDVPMPEEVGNCIPRPPKG